MNHPPASGMPWYRYPYVWLFLIIVPGLALTGTATLLYIAITNTDSGVIESYHQRGKSPGQATPLEAVAASRDLLARLTLTPDKIIVTFNQRIDGMTALTLLFRHPTLEKQDFSLPLTRISEQQYTVAAPDNIRGNKWDLLIDAQMIGTQSIIPEGTSEAISETISETASEKTSATEKSWRIKGRLLQSESSILLSPTGSQEPSSQSTTGTQPTTDSG